MDELLVENEGAVLYTRVEGKGPYVLLLHGNAEDHHYFDVLILELVKSYCVIAVDTRAHGRSTDGNLPLDFDLFARDVKSVLDCLKIHQVHILGFSDGGNIALTFALNYPRYIKSLILNGANLFPAGIHFKERVSDLFRYAVCSILSVFSDKMRKRKDYLALMIKHPHIDPAKLKNVKVGSLVVAGEYDVIKRSHTELIASALPKSSLLIIPDADHFAAQKKPEIFNKIVSDFLQMQIQNKDVTHE